MKMRQIILITILTIIVVFINHSDMHCSNKPKLFNFRTTKSNISLLSIVELQRKEAQKLLVDANLFEVNTLITTKDINTGIINENGLTIISGFASPKNSIKFVRIGTHVKDGNKVEEQQMDLVGFLIGICPEGVVDTNGPRCDAETGESEELSSHLPIKNLKLDILDILYILRENGFENKQLKSTRAETVTLSITTIGRVRTASITSSPMSHSYSLFYKHFQEKILLDKLPNDQAVIIAIYQETPGKYIVINAENGKVLSKGSMDLY